jgi:hypothetical protein
MTLPKLRMVYGPEFASAPAHLLDRPLRRASDKRAQNNRLIYGGVALGVLAGIAISAYWWRRARALNLQEAPFDRVEELIASCESKIEDIERAIEELKEAAL